MRNQLPFCFTNESYGMREDEGRKLMKPLMLKKLMRVAEMIPNDSPYKQKIHSLVQKVRYKQYLLTKDDMVYVNEVFLKMKGSQ